MTCDYGDLSGLNKDEARKEMGRGAGTYPAQPAPSTSAPPEGESLKEGLRPAQKTVLPDYKAEIQPLLLRHRRKPCWSPLTAIRSGRW